MTRIDTTIQPDTQPFDAVAEFYDAQFTQSRLGRLLRKAVHGQLAGLFQPGSRVLELGCGTGEDAIWLAQQGIQITATDASSAMLAVAARKASAAAVGGQIAFAQLDLFEASDWRAQGAPAIDDWEPVLRDSQPVERASTVPQSPVTDHPSSIAPYDGVLANFGVLNCLPDRRPLAEALARWVRPGGHVALVVMSPICPWEIVWHLAHGQLGPAFRRFRSGTRAHVGEDASQRVWYPTLRRLRAEFAPAFYPIKSVGIGVLLPPSYLDHLVDRWPRLFERMATWERRLGTFFPWTWLNDHYLLILRRI